MVVKECNFDPRRDIAPVRQDGYIDLVEAFENRVIPSESGSASLDFEDCDDTNSLFPKPENVFDTIQQSHTLREYKDNSTPEESA